MRAVVFHEHGSTDLLRVEEFPDPELQSGDALIEVGATSINGFDPQIVAGSTGLKTPLPMVPCGDYAGRIVEFGPETNSGNWAVGDPKSLGTQGEMWTVHKQADSHVAG